MLKVRDIMIHDVYTVHQDDLVRVVLEKFAAHRISGMPIIDSHHHLVGYISDGDIMRYLGKHANQDFNSWTSAVGYYYGVNIQDPTGRVPEEERDKLKENALLVCNKSVMKVAAKKVITVREDDDLVHVSETLAKRNIKKVPVVGTDGLLVGIVSRGDVVRAVVQKILMQP